MTRNVGKVRLLRSGAEDKQLADPAIQSDGNRPSLRQAAYEKLKDAIQRLQLEPGKVTSDSELARLLGMSRTPVREALTLLERDLLVTRIPNQGVLIRSLTIDEVVHIMQMREALDGMAARLAADRIGEDLLSALESDFEGMMKASMSSSDLHSALSKRLHTEILKAAGNPFLQSASEVLTSSFDRTRQHSWRIWNSARDAQKIALRRYREHMEIIAALKARDPRRAEKAARAHVVSGLSDILKSVTRTR
jgi:GntR family transcriptional regulator, rspAB operon transcriptional repressor